MLFYPFLSTQSTSVKCYLTQFSKQLSRQGLPALHALPHGHSIPSAMASSYAMAQTISCIWHTHCSSTVCPQMSPHHSSSCLCSYVTSAQRPFLPAPHKCLPVMLHSTLTLAYFCLQPCHHLPSGLCIL